MGTKGRSHLSMEERERERESRRVFLRLPRARARLLERAGHWEAARARVETIKKRGYRAAKGSSLVLFPWPDAKHESPRLLGSLSLEAGCVDAREYSACGPEQGFPLNGGRCARLKQKLNGKGSKVLRLDLNRSQSIFDRCLCFCFLFFFYELAVVDCLFVF